MEAKLLWLFPYAYSNQLTYCPILKKLSWHIVAAVIGAYELRSDGSIPSHPV